MIKKFRNLLASLLVISGIYMLPLIVMASIPTYTGFTTRADGYVVTAANWNGEFSNFISFVNTNLVGAFNTLSSKGYLLTSDGTNIISLTNAGSGDDTKMLALDSTQTAGMKWVAPIANSANLTTKGDLVGYSTNLVRIPVGANTQVLTANSAVAAGVDWETIPGIPQGVITLWSGSAATIPTGWALCDGNPHTYNGNTSTPPNLQGLFVVAAGNSSPAASGGMGLLAPGGPTGDTSGGAGLGPVANITVNTLTIHTSASGPNQNVVTAVTPGKITPKYYALCYIQKL